MNTEQLTLEYWATLNKPQKTKLLKEISDAHPLLEFKKMQSFGMNSVSIETGVYDLNGATFVFIPGGEITLGWDNWQGEINDFTQEILDSAKYTVTDDFNYSSFEEYLHKHTSRERTVIMPPMIVEQTPWEGIELFEVSPEKVYEIDAELKQSATRTFSGYRPQTQFTTYRDEYTIRMKKEGNEPLRAFLTASLSVDDLAMYLKGDGFVLPNQDQWEYFCGGGTRTMFRWGNGFTNKDDHCIFTPYKTHDLNMFGLKIAYDPYKTEVIHSDDTFKAGDGGISTCGGWGAFLDNFSLSTFYRDNYFYTHFGGACDKYFRRAISVK